MGQSSIKGLTLSRLRISSMVAMKMYFLRQLKKNTFLTTIKRIAAVARSRPWEDFWHTFFGSLTPHLPSPPYPPTPFTSPPPSSNLPSPSPTPLRSKKSPTPPPPQTLPSYAISYPLLLPQPLCSLSPFNLPYPPPLHSFRSPSFSPLRRLYPYPPLTLSLQPPPFIPIPHPIPPSPLPLLLIITQSFNLPVFLPFLNPKLTTIRVCPGPPRTGALCRLWVEYVQLP